MNHEPDQPLTRPQHGLRPVPRSRPRTRPACGRRPDRVPDVDRRVEPGLRSTRLVRGAGRRRERRRLLGRHRRRPGLRPSRRSAVRSRVRVLRLGHGSRPDACMVGARGHVLHVARLVRGSGGGRERRRLRRRHRLDAELQQRTVLGRRGVRVPRFGVRARCHARVDRRGGPGGREFRLPGRDRRGCQRRRILGRDHRCAVLRQRPAGRGAPS